MLLKVLTVAHPTDDDGINRAEDGGQSRLLKKTILVPTLALTGENDGCMDTRLHELIMRPADFPRGLKILRVSGAGHFLHQEKPDLFIQKLIEYLQDSEHRTF